MAQQKQDDHLQETRPYKPRPWKMLIAAVLCFVGGGAIGSIVPPVGGFVMFLSPVYLVVAGLDFWRRKRIEKDRKDAVKPSGSLGKARFATNKECKKNGLGNPGGLYLGYNDTMPLFHNGSAHLLTVAPSGAGKGANVVIPNLLHYPGSAFVTDPKGELAKVTSKHRREQFGHDVFVLNPWGLHDLPQHHFNPLAVLPKMGADPRRKADLSDEVKAMALQLIPEPEDRRNAFFREGGRAILRAVLLYMATRGDPERCTLPELWRNVTSSKRLKEAIAQMCESQALNGMVADLGEDLSHQVAENGEQFGDFRQNAVQAVDIFDPAGWLGEAVSGHDVDLGDLKARNMTVYVVIPQDKVATHGAWLGMLTQRAITDVGRDTGRGSVLFLLDEFANMGKLSALSESITALRGKGVRLWIFLQELAQIEQLYGKSTAETVFSQAEVKQFFGVSNDALAKRVSEMMGQTTVKVPTYHLGARDDVSPGATVGEHQRPLMSPDEVQQMDNDEQLLFINGLRPILAQRAPVWALKPLRKYLEPNPVEGPYPKTRLAATIPKAA